MKWACPVHHKQLEWQSNGQQIMLTRTGRNGLAPINSKGCGKNLRLIVRKSSFAFRPSPNIDLGVDAAVLIPVTNDLECWITNAQF